MLFGRNFQLPPMILQRETSFYFMSKHWMKTVISFMQVWSLIMPEKISCPRVMKMIILMSLSMTNSVTASITNSWISTGERFSR